MSENEILGLSCLLMLIAVIVAFLVLIVNHHIEGKGPQWRKFFITCAIIAPGYLWMPWMFYAIRWTYRLNTNAVNYLERKEIVIPKEPETIDLNKKKEQP